MMTVGLLEYLLSIADEDAKIDWDTLIDDLDLRDEQPPYDDPKSYYTIEEMVAMDVADGLAEWPENWATMSEQERYAFWDSIGDEEARVEALEDKNPGRS